jgi:hypothetical protein
MDEPTIYVVTCKNCDMTRQYSDREDAEDAVKVHRRKKTAHGDHHRVSMTERPATWEGVVKAANRYSTKSLTPAGMVEAVKMLETGEMPPELIARFRKALQAYDQIGPTEYKGLSTPTG